MPLEVVNVSGAGSSLTGLASSEGHPDKPLLVLVHGGGVNAHYFAVAESSLIDLAAANGFPAVAINRPGYAGSPALRNGDESFARQAEVIDAAVEELLRSRGTGPGAVVFGHSIGGAITVHLAARRPAWALLGISITGITASPPPFLVELWKSMPANQSVAFGSELGAVIDVSDASSQSKPAPLAGWQEPTPSAELLEIATKWPADFDRVGAEVAVPVQYAVGERDKFWLVNGNTASACAAMFTNAPYIDAQVLPGVGHEIDHEGDLGRSHQLRQLSFALRCTGAPQPGMSRRRRSSA